MPNPRLPPWSRPYILSETDLQFLVWEPVTGDLSRVAFPPEFGSGGSAEFEVEHAAVLRAPGDVHAGEDNSIPFLVALVGRDQGYTRAFACVYSSETGLWGNLISRACPSILLEYTPSTLVGRSLYWLLELNQIAILEFDLDTQLLEVIDAPLNNLPDDILRYRVMPAEGGGLGFFCITGFSAQLWIRKMDCDGNAGWVLGRTIELDKLLSLNSEVALPPYIFGFAEDNNMCLLMTHNGGIMVKLDSTQFKKPFEIKRSGFYHPFASVYAGIGFGDGHGGVELLHNT